MMRTQHLESRLLNNQSQSHALRAQGHALRPSYSAPVRLDNLIRKDSVSDIKNLQKRFRNKLAEYFEAIQQAMKGESLRSGM